MMHIVIMWGVVGSSPNLLWSQEAANNWETYCTHPDHLHHHCHCYHHHYQHKKSMVMSNHNNYFLPQPPPARSFYRRVGRPKNQPQAILYSPPDQAQLSAAPSQCSPPSLSPLCVFKSSFSLLFFSSNLIFLCYAWPSAAFSRLQLASAPQLTRQPPAPAL